MKKEKSVKKSNRDNAVLKQLKSLIFPLIMCAIIVAGIIFVLNYKGKETEEKIIAVHGYDGSDKPIVMENADLKFTMDPLTTQFTLEVKKTGKVWYSNPQDVDSDTIALNLEKNYLKSTLTMSYCSDGGAEVKFNSWQQSVANGLYEIETGDNFVKILYSLGNVEREYYIPPVTTETKYDAWCAQMSNTDKMFVDRNYKKYDINNLGAKDDKEALLASYPILETEVIYVLRDKVGPASLQKMETIFESLGYSVEDYQADKELDFAEKVSDKPIFNINVIYRLDGDEFIVEVPINEMEFKDEYPIYAVCPLPYFGAGGTEDEGYLLVPEGGGAIINFNSGKTAQSSYYSNLYGWDMALRRDAVVHNTRSYFNAFGIASGEDSMLCILDGGRSYASVRADISGKANSYNFANALYTVCQREQFEMDQTGTNTAIYVYQKNLQEETISQRYRFLNTTDYADMARSYREYLLKEYDGYFTKNEDSSTPVSIEIVGAVDKVKQVLGVPVSRPLELTSYKDAQAMIQKLSDQGMKNMSVKLSGWCNGGIYQKVLSKVKLISDLGSKKDLKNMISTAGSLGVDVYLDGVTHYAYNSDIFDGFFSYTDAAKLISKERAELHPYSVVTFAERENWKNYFLLHTDKAMEMAKNLSDFANKYGAGVSYRDTGKDLSADYYRKKLYSRQSVLELQQEMLKGQADAGQNVMINMGNDYALPYADIVTNMNLRGSQYTILDGFVPFYEIAIHGYVNYTGESLNLSENLQDELLRSAEYGAGLSFTLMQQSAFALQKTLYTEYYGADFNAWNDTIMEIYNRYNSELGHVYNQEMTGHEILAPGFTCTTYEDGTKVYVNYDYEAAVAPSGEKIPARDYKVIR